MFSTTITAPSTMMPKSIAPSESRFAGMPRMRRPMNVASSDSGMIDRDDRRRARRLPQEQNSTSVTSSAPSSRLWNTVVERLVDEPGAVVERHDLHALRQDDAFSCVDALLHRLQHDRRVLALAHQHDALDDVVVVVLPDDALARHGADVDRARCRLTSIGVPLVLGDDDVADVVRRAQQADAADQELLLALLDVAAAGVRVAAAERGEQLLQRDVVAPSCARDRRSTWYCLMRPPKLTTSATPGDQLADCALDDPVLSGAQLVGVDAVALDAVAVDLADRRRERRELRLHAGGQIDLRSRSRTCWRAK